MLFFKKYGIGGVIFDIDGTLIDSLSLYHLHLNEGLEDIGLPPISKNILFEYIRMNISLKDIVRKIADGDKDTQTIDKAVCEILDRFMEIDIEIELLPGVRDVFEFLGSMDIRIGLATGRVSSAGHEWNRLKKQGLDSLVSAVVTASEVSNRKPAPDVITKCAMEMKMPIKECLSVGDSVPDILAAKSAGAIPIAVTTGIEKSNRLNEQGPEAILETLSGLIGLLNNNPEKM